MTTSRRNGELNAIAREIDRLVWAVGDIVREQQAEMPSSSALAPATFGPLLNLLAFRDHLTEQLIRRRYIYRPEPILTAFLADVATTGLFVREGDRLVPTERLSPIVDEVNAAVDRVSRDLWYAHQDTVLSVSEVAGDVRSAAEDNHGLVTIAQTIDDAPDAFHLCWQRLTGLRLVRNESHVNAWRAFDLGPVDVEALTGSWADTSLQGPAMHSENLIDLGYAADGAITDLGLDVRRQIEDATDAGVRSVFEERDPAAFLEMLKTLPPWS